MVLEVEVRLVDIGATDAYCWLIYVFVLGAW